MAAAANTVPDPHQSDRFPLKELKIHAMTWMNLGE